ncbi:aldo/keto reductase [Natranaerobius thermophilus]|uniref:Aldo/keto reductase n=1 Tax=Natranaerobius thermophilus (strain ATCC BAA-1301 / DSM 18059 / JW/NM-WN-LF) TaxID=457570 RepID=B2A6E6_NATTJ|nr:aldo/keto reductase [Natranaerobius thermophilus]ACB84160.1 aldo/keto reductase [Natranaerobius thermophilus JW/NM-WN-LF]
MKERQLGKTGIKVKLFSLGGEATVEQRGLKREAIELINKALDLGVNYIDTAPAYGEGGSEENIGMVMKDRRDEVTLASKTPERTYDDTMKSFEKSLKRLQTDYLDIYQVHDIKTEAELLQVLDQGEGAIKALEELKANGDIRFIGITGHKRPKPMLKGIKEYDFDTVLHALNPGDIHYNSFKTEFLEEAVNRQLGIIAMKVTAVGKIFANNKSISMGQILNYVWSHPISTAIIGISNLKELEENVNLAQNFTPYTTEQIKDLEEKTASNQRQVNFFKYEW